MVTIKLKVVNKVQSFYDVNLVHLVHISTAKLFDIVINWHLLPFYDKMINQFQESYWHCMMTFEKKVRKGYGDKTDTLSFEVVVVPTKKLS